MTISKKNIHFVGVGGIGMSGIAQVLLEMGHEVSGSDVELNSITKKLEAIGGRMLEGHKASNVSPDTDILVYSSSISKDNPEMKAALRQNVKVMHRAEMLGQIFNSKKGIAVTGTHGKTTTTSLVAVMLENAGADPTVIIGGEVNLFSGNAKLGLGPYAVAEADESDSSFLHLEPLYAAVMNIEMEHMDHFKSMEHIHSSYRAFVNNIKENGAVFYNIDDLNVRMVMKGSRKKSETFGFSKNADMYPADIKMDGFNTSFKCVYKNIILGTVNLKIPGRHNVSNAMAAVLIGLKMGLGFKEIAHAIKDFDGAKRRFQLRADSDGVMLIEDYAHHPTEIRAVLRACRNWKGKRVIAIFQPHRYTRTKFLANDFGQCFAGADKLILTDIYAASEKAIKGVSIKNIYDRVKRSGLKDVEIVEKDEIPQYIMSIKKPGDMILVLGAGDIKEVANRLCGMMDKASEGGAAGKYSADEELLAGLRKSVRGRIKLGERLSLRTSLRIGGDAGIWVEPADEGDLEKVLAFSRSRRIPMFVIGNGSNLLASDGGFNGILIRLASPAFNGLKIKGSTVRVGAGYSLPKFVRICCEKGLGGMESLVGIPGTIGGAIYMNAGGYNNPIYRNIGEFVASLKVMDYDGKVKVLKKSDLKFGYRSSNLDRYIVLEAELRLGKGDRLDLDSSCIRFLKMKKEKQALDMPSAGCMFKNPDNFQFTCGQMIDMLKLKGKRIGGAEISAKHANFIVNRKGATCRDVLELVKFIKDKVRENYGIDLELEVKVI